MPIQQTAIQDIPTLINLFEKAREYMAKTGNPHQWINGYPSEEIIRKDTEAGHSFVYRNEAGKIVATFCFTLGEDATYRKIYQGRWLNELPYGVIHRIASDGSTKGFGKICLDWCFTQINNIRIDTHQDNKVMQNILKNYGFRYCGIILTHNGTERLAFQKTI